MRDRQIASALGKPLMINDQDCDVELLTLDDFEIGDSEEMRHFVIQQAKLSILCKTLPATTIDILTKLSQLEQ